jgi:hypothetical protein
MKETRIGVGDSAEFVTGPGGIRQHVINHGTFIEVRSADASIIPEMVIDVHPPNQVFIQAKDPNREEE